MTQADILKKMKDKTAKTRTIDTRKSPTVMVRNEFLEALFRDSNLTALKIMFFLARAEHKPTATGNKLLTFSLDLKELNEFANTSKRALKSNLINMQKTTITFLNTNEKDKIEEYISMLPRVKIITGKNLVEVDVYQQVYDLVAQVEEKFSKIAINDLLSVNSIYAFRMLMLLERFDNYKGMGIKKQGTYALDELNAMFSTNYKRLGQLEQNVLSVAKRDLEKSTSRLSFEWELDYDKVSSGRGRPKATEAIIKMIRVHKESQNKQSIEPEEDSSFERTKEEPEPKKEYPKPKQPSKPDGRLELGELALKHVYDGASDNFEIDIRDMEYEFRLFKNHQLSKMPKTTKKTWSPLFQNWLHQGGKYRTSFSYVMHTEYENHPELLDDE